MSKITNFMKVQLFINCGTPAHTEWELFKVLTSMSFIWGVETSEDFWGIPNVLVSVLITIDQLAGAPMLIKGWFKKNNEIFIKGPDQPAHPPWQNKIKFL